jgi:hypothetical protein
MQWLAHQLQLQGKRVFACAPRRFFRSRSAVFRRRGQPGEDRHHLPVLRALRSGKHPDGQSSSSRRGPRQGGHRAADAGISGGEARTRALPPSPAAGLLGGGAECAGVETLAALIPPSWVMDPAPLPPGAVLDGPIGGGRALNDWRELAGASQKERDLIIKISGYHETAWGARSVVLGSDCSREEWQEGVEQALAAGADEPARPAGIPESRAGVEHPLYAKAGPEPGRVPDGPACGFVRIIFSSRAGRGSRAPSRPSARRTKRSSMGWLMQPCSHVGFSP